MSFQPAPGDLLRHVRLTSAAGFDGASLLQNRWLLRRRGARRHGCGCRLVRTVSELEGVDHAGCHEDGGGEPGHEIVEPGIDGAGWHNGRYIRVA